MQLFVFLVSLSIVCQITTSFEKENNVGSSGNSQSVTNDKEDKFHSSDKIKVNVEKTNKKVKSKKQIRAQDNDESSSAKLYPKVNKETDLKDDSSSRNDEVKTDSAQLKKVDKDYNKHESLSGKKPHYKTKQSTDGRDVDAQIKSNDESKKYSNKIKNSRIGHEDQTAPSKDFDGKNEISKLDKSNNVDKREKKVGKQSKGTNTEEKDDEFTDKNTIVKIDADKGELNAQTKHDLNDQHVVHAQLSKKSQNVVSDNDNNNKHIYNDAPVASAADLNDSSKKLVANAQTKEGDLNKDSLKYKKRSKDHELNDQHMVHAQLSKKIQNVVNDDDLNNKHVQNDAPVASAADLRDSSKKLVANAQTKEDDLNKDSLKYEKRSKHHHMDSYNAKIFKDKQKHIHQFQNNKPMENNFGKYIDDYEKVKQASNKILKHHSLNKKNEEFDDDDDTDVNKNPKQQSKFQSDDKSSKDETYSFQKHNKRFPSIKRKIQHPRRYKQKGTGSLVFVFLLTACVLIGVFVFIVLRNRTKGDRLSMRGVGKPGGYTRLQDTGADNVQQTKESPQAYIY